MKKIIYAILGIFMMVACTDDHMEDIPTPPQGETSGTVNVSFSVQVPEANAIGSRSFSAPAINSLHLAVFDANGYLSEVVEAKRAAGETGLGTAENPIEFTVDLNQTPSKRIIHFLANKTIDATQFGTESDLIGALYTTGTEDAYWQRVELPEGINYAWTDTNNNGIQDEGEPILFNTIGDKLTKVPLIRNFAKITVTAYDVFTPGEADFTLEGFTVVNVPDRGSVAPFNTNGGGFAQYVDANKIPYGYNNLTAGADGYTGFVPNDAIIDDEVGSFLDEDAKFYMYERNDQAKNVNRTFVIVKGKFGTEASSYYKIDLTYTNDDNTIGYYEILRNFHYNINITQVESSGAKSPEEAATMTGSHNNLSASVETQSLLNISDGESRLFVNYTEYVFVGSGETMELKYRYVPDIDSPNDENNGEATYTLEELNNVDKAVASITASNADDSQGWRTLTVKAAEMDANNVKQQTLTLVAGNLSRTINFMLRSKYNFSNEMATSPSPANTLKGAFTYSFTIPDNIPESLFPLTFVVQGDPENIYPNADLNSLPVQILDGQQTFGYEREVTWEEYQQTGGIINCYFRVNTTSYVGTKITVSNKYFNDSEEVELNNNNTTYEFSNLVVNGGSAVPYGTGRSVTFTFNMPVAKTVTITAGKMSETPITSTTGTITAISRANNNGFTYTPRQAGAQSITFTTAEFASADRIMLNAEGYITAIKPYDNVLKIKANSVTGTTEPALDNNSKIRVYASESDAIAYGNNPLAEVTRNVLINNETDIALTGPTEESVLYFAYSGSTHIYVAEATVGDLAQAKAAITFSDSYEKPLEWSATLTGEQYYGVGKTVTLTLTTNKPGTYKVSFAETGTNGTNEDPPSITIAEGQTTGTATYTTKSWSGAISATVTSEKNETLSVTGDSRNVLKITATIANNNSNAENYITDDDNGNTEIRIRSANNDNNGTTTYGTITARTLRNGTAEITYDGLTATPDVYFRFTYWYYDRGYKQGTGSANITPENATGTGTLTFN